MPILFFGDSDRFAESAVRIVTVGLNPSRVEFPADDPFRRFPAGLMANAARPEMYLASLNGYFRTHPYRSWFDGSFEPLLRGTRASYYDGAESVALHTDLCSPLATDPTWSRLDRQDQRVLQDRGQELWHALIEELQPDVVLVSIARRYLNEIRFTMIDEPTVVHTVTEPNRKHPYAVEACRRELVSGKVALFVFGRAAQKPFGLISTRDRELVGARVREVLGA